MCCLLKLDIGGVLSVREKIQVRGDFSAVKSSLHKQRLSCHYRTLSGVICVGELSHAAVHFI